MEKTDPATRTRIASLRSACILLLAPAARGEESVRVISAELANSAVLLRERALIDNLSVDILESLTTEVGPRRMGTHGDRRAIAWAQAKFKELGFDRVWIEEVALERGWVRGEASAEIVSPASSMARARRTCARDSTCTTTTYERCTTP